MGEFNPSQLGATNVKAARDKLEKAFGKQYAENFIIVLWNVARKDRKVSFETSGDVKNVFYFSGFDGSILSFLTGSGVKESQEKAALSAYDVFLAAMDQEILQQVEI